MDLTIWGLIAHIFWQGHQFTSQLWSPYRSHWEFSSTILWPITRSPMAWLSAFTVIWRLPFEPASLVHTGPRHLPWVLLGIRTAPKEDLGCSLAELVYGQPLTVTGDFISSHNHPADRASELLCWRKQASALVPIPTSQHGARRSPLPQYLEKAKFVFIRRDGHRAPLQRPYEGPFRVIEPGIKTFKVDIGGKTETITVDRLKPAHLDLNCPVEVAQPRPRGRPKGSTVTRQAEQGRSSSPPASIYHGGTNQAGRSTGHVVTYLFWGGGGLAAGSNRILIIVGRWLIRIV